MARRTLIDIDGQMIKAAIKIGGRDGIDNITSRKVAQICGVTDPLIFVHYGTMDNLIENAFKYAMNVIMEGVNNLTLGGVEKWESNWDELIRWHLENAELTQFLYNVINSRYGFKVPEKLQEFFVNVCKPLIGDKNKDVPEEEMFIYYYMTYQHFLHFITRLIRGDIQNNERNAQLARKLVLGGYKL